MSYTWSFSAGIVALWYIPDYYHGFISGYDTDHGVHPAQVLCINIHDNLGAGKQ